MPKYHVHVYREARVYFPSIVAGSPEEAAKIASDMPTEDAFLTEHCDSDPDLGALVDLDGDEGHEHSVMIDFERGRMEKAAADMWKALQGAQRLILDMGKIIRGIDDNNEWLEFWTQDGDYLCSDSRYDEVIAAIAKARG